MNIIITGATGLIGRKLAGALHAKGHSITVFSRSPEKASSLFPFPVTCVRWEAEADGDWSSKIDGADAVIHLAGANVGEGRWTTARKKEILESREIGTRGIANAILAAKNPPKVLLSSSAVGIYGNTGDTLTDEDSSYGDDFLAEVCKVWEYEAGKAASATRVVLARTGIVLDYNEGALSKLKTSFQFFIGGPLGSGRQWMPWIHIDDVVAMYVWALENTNVSGPVNFCVPEPCTMNTFAKTLGKALHRPSLFPVPSFVLRTILGEQHIIVTGGQRAIPQKAISKGFKWQHPDLLEALKQSIA